MPSVRGVSPFPTTLETLKALLADQPPGNRWVKVNLHVHGQGHDPAEVVRQARAAELDLIAITDHQTFRYHDPIAEAATAPGRLLTVLVGMEITALEGAHLLAVFPFGYSPEQRAGFCGWLEIDGSGDPRVASRRKVHEILQKVEKDEGGVIVVPHPFAQDIGLLDGARKLSTKMEWLESGHIRLFQVSETTKNKVKYIGHCTGQQS
jgi:predicted metal-dependent phosphoesterase TrpH